MKKNRKINRRLEKKNYTHTLRHRYIHRHTRTSPLARAIAFIMQGSNERTKKEKHATKMVPQCLPKQTKCARSSCQPASQIYAFVYIFLHIDMRNDFCVCMCGLNILRWNLEVYRFISLLVCSLNSVCTCAQCTHIDPCKYNVTNVYY